MKKKIILFVSIVLVVCLGICLGVYFLFFNKKYEKFDGSFGVASNDFIKSYSNGDLVNVYISYETHAKTKIKEMSFKIRYSDGLKFIKDDINKGKIITDYKVKNNKYDIKINGKSIINDDIGFQFAVLDENKELYVELYDIILTDQNGNQYKIDSKKALLYENGILYRCVDSSFYSTVNGKNAVIYSRYNYLEFQNMKCEEVNLNVDKSYIPVHNLWHDTKVLFYKNSRYYLYDIKQEKFVLETEKLFDLNSNPIYAISYIDSGGENANAYGVVVGDGQIYINLDKNEAYYGFNKHYESRDASFITSGNDVSFDGVKTTGKLIKARLKDFYYDIFGLFNGEDYTLLTNKYTSCEENENYNLECYKEYNNGDDGVVMVSLFDSNGKLLFDSDDMYSYFYNIDKDHVIYKLYEPDDSNIYIKDYNKKTVGFINNNDIDLEQNPLIYYINEELVNSCFDFDKVDYNMSNYLMVQVEENLKVYKKNSNNQFIYYKNLRYCSD
mgnify:FL=1